MRKIKFRLWDQIHKKMVIDIPSHFTFTLEDGELIVGGYAPNGDWYEPVHMQSIGITDIKGKEIYEGDILSENDCLFIVKWDNQWAKFKLESIGCIQYPEWNRGRKMKVIGNIYENIDLIK